MIKMNKKGTVNWVIITILLCITAVLITSVIVLNR